MCYVRILTSCPVSLSDLFIMHFGVCRRHEFSRSFGPRTVMLCDQVIVSALFMMTFFLLRFQVPYSLILVAINFIRELMFHCFLFSV